MRIWSYEIVDPVVGRAFWLWCPGCEDLHRIATPPWNQMGPESFEPSIKVGGTQWPEGHEFYKPQHSSVKPGKDICCHSFLRDGVWLFLEDSTHALRGQNVPMVEIPKLYGIEDLPSSI